MDNPTVMLKIDSGIWVNALEIAAIKRNAIELHIVVYMRDGREFLAVPEYSSIYDLEKKIVEHINHAALLYAGKVETNEPKFKPAKL